MSKNRVPVGDCSGRFLGSPQEPPPFGHCCSRHLSVIWPWRAAQKGCSEATVLIVRWHMELQSPAKGLPDCPRLSWVCGFCRPGRWPLTYLPANHVVPFLLPCQQPWRECGNQLQAIWKVWDWLFSQYKLEGWVGSKFRAQALVPGMNRDLITVSATGTETIMKEVYHHVDQHWCG